MHSDPLHRDTHQLHNGHHFGELLDVMRRFARQGDGSHAWWGALEVHFREFTKAFLAHEHAENNLCQEAYDRDIGAED